MKNLRTNQQGSIALITIMIISAILLILVLGTSESQVSTSYQQLNTNSGKYAYYISEACLEEVMSRFKDDSSYAGGTLTPDSDAECAVTVTGDGTKTVDITTVYGNYTNSYQAQISITSNGQANNIRLLNWEKI